MPQPENTAPDALFFTSKEGAFYWHTGRRTVLSTRFRGIPPDSLGKMLRGAGVTYAVVSPIGVGRRSHNTVIARACREFEKVATFEGDAVLLRIRENGPIDHEDETCQLLAQWKNGVPLRWRQ